MKKLIGIIGLVLMGGCATTPDPQRLAMQEQINQTIPTCSGVDDCNAKWEAAQLWIVHNSAYKIQTATSVLIETYNPSQHSPSLAARVTKEPQGGGKYRLLVALWCDNMFGCAPDAYAKALEFNKAVGAATP
ncbi:MAG: hypothetical protein Q8M84_02990 [Thiobacillus sp.]|nr:hypothetical protein [Thiobacillus sp.]